MSEKTKSERLFEELCKERCIPCHRIPEGCERAADYELDLGGLVAVAEVKEISLNAEDTKKLETGEGSLAPGGVAPTTRLRDLIATAYKQLKNSCRESVPGIIVVYNNSPIWNHIDMWTATTAMFGGYQMTLGTNPNGGWDVKARRFGGKRRVTKSENRAISALCVIDDHNPSHMKMVAYHNPYARHPITPEHLGRLANEQYIHPDPHTGQYVDWKPVQISGDSQ